MKITYGFLLSGVIITSASGCGGESGAKEAGPCESAVFPGAPEGASSSVYVASACPAAGADGSKEHPFPTITEGIHAAAPGAAVLVAPGTYAEALTIDKKISLVGSSDPERADSAAVTLKPPAAIGIEVKAGDDVRIRGVVIQDAKEAGIRVKGGSVTVEGSRIENTQIGGDKSVGYGVAVGNSSIILQHSAVTGSASHAVVALNARAIILQNAINDNRGYGVVLNNLTEEGRVEGNLLSNNVGVGLSVSNSKAIILQNDIKDTASKKNPDDDGEVPLGYGVYVGAPAGESEISTDVTMRENIVHGNGRVGVLLAAGARAIILQKNTIDENGLKSTTKSSAGIWIQGGAGSDMSSTIDNNELSGNRYVGIGLTGDSHAIILQNNAVIGTVMGTAFMGSDEFEMGDGIGVFKGASARITGNTISMNARFGLILDDALGASTTISGNKFSGHDEYDIILQNQADAPTTDTNGLPTMTINAEEVEEIPTAEKGTFPIWDKELDAPLP